MKTIKRIAVRLLTALQIRNKNAIVLQESQSCVSVVSVSMSVEQSAIRIETRPGDSSSSRTQEELMHDDRSGFTPPITDDPAITNASNNCRGSLNYTHVTYSFLKSCFCPLFLFWDWIQDNMFKQWHILWAKNGKRRSVRFSSFFFFYSVFFFSYFFFTWRLLLDNFYC